MAKIVTIKWQPQPRQAVFLDACGLLGPVNGKPPGKPKADVIGYGGAAGGGKSDTLLLAGIIACLSFSGCSVGYFRRTYPALEGPGGAIQRSHEILSGIAKWNGSQRRWTFPNGSILQFCHAKTESDVFVYQSQQFDVLLIDEATQFTRFQVRYLMTRNRATVKGITPFTAMATNPGNIGHSWFKADFIQAGIIEQPFEVEVEPGQYENHIFIPAKLADNQILEKRDPGYRKRLENQDENTRRALLDGDWDVFEGQYFTEWRNEKHVIQPFDIPHTWRKFVSMDWGYNAPACVLWHTVSPEKRIYTYRELYTSRMAASEMAETIIDMSQGETIEYYKGSPDMWQERGLIDKKRQQQGETIADEFRKHGVYIQPADNRRVMGWMRMREYLKDGSDGLPMWQFFSNCENTIRTMPELIYSETNIEDVHEDCEDHCAEAARYFIMSRPPLHEAVKGINVYNPTAKRKKWEDDDEDYEYLRDLPSFYG